MLEIPVSLYSVDLLVTNKFLCNPVRVIKKMDCPSAVHTAIKIKNSYPFTMFTYLLRTEELSSPLLIQQQH